MSVRWDDHIQGLMEGTAAYSWNEVQNRLRLMADLANSRGADIVLLKRDMDQIRIDNKKLLDALEKHQAAMRDAAQNLANAGDFTHRDKNEVILRVISRLLSFAYYNPLATGYEDLPF